MCDYCAGIKYILDTQTTMSYKGDFFPGVHILIDDDELCVDAVADVYEPHYIEEKTKINYCPMCGRKLKETKNV